MKTKRNETAEAIARKVLHDAANAQHFFDLSDGERLLWMLSRAAELGAAARLQNDVVPQRTGRANRRPRRPS